MHKKLLSSAIMLLMVHFSIAQLSYVRYDSIRVVIAGDTLMDNAWAGGFNNPQFSDIDLNGDNIKDLFVFDRNGSWYAYTIKTFINKGTANQVDYHFAPEYIPLFPSMHDFALLVDYNCDGREDIFTYSNAGMAVYRTDYDTLLKFTMVTPLLKSDYMPGYQNLYIAPTDLPAFIDVDNDGDLDILTFSVWGTLVEYHQNQSMELYGHCDSLIYVMVDGCWGKFFESAWNCGVTYPINCKGAVGGGETPNDQYGSALLSLDVDADGDKELVLGNVDCPTLNIVINGGDPSFAQINAHDSLFPSNHQSTTAVDFIFPAGYYLDVDNDNVEDLIVVPYAPNIAENLTSVWHYKNNGATDYSDFEFKKNNFLQEEMIEVGAGANPAFFDASADSLLDLIIGNYGYFDTSGFYPSGLAYFKNTGTATKPEFELVTRDYMGIMAKGINSTYPTFGDLDNDGDDDMILGDYDGLLHYYENTALPSNPANFVLSVTNYMNIDVGLYSAPQIVDVNKDGLLDLLVGERSGTLNYFENTGTLSSAFFNSTATSDTFGGIDALIPCCTGFSSPFLTTLDSTGDYSLFVGTERGIILLYDNIDGNLTGVFNLVDSFPGFGYRLSVFLADINGDNDKELIYGEYAGGVIMLTQGDSVPIPYQVEEPNDQSLDFKLFPNPAGESLTLQFSFNSNQPVHVEITDLLGRKVKGIGSRIINGSRIKLDLASMNNGMYLINVRNGHKSASAKFIKL